MNYPLLQACWSCPQPTRVGLYAELVPSRRAVTPQRLHIVTGKGGTGKTTVAAALALGLASHGQRVLLIEVEGRQGLAQLFDSPPLPLPRPGWPPPAAAR